MSIVLFLCLAASLIALQLWRTWWRLRNIPGLFPASITNFQRMSWTGTKRAHLILQQMHEKHGEVVRIGPNMVSFSNPKAIPVVYPMRPGFPKSDFYVTLRPYTRRGGALHAVFNTTDEKLHKEIKSPIAPMFSMTNTTSFEPLVHDVLKCIMDQWDRRFAAKGVIFDLGHTGRKLPKRRLRIRSWLLLSSFLDDPNSLARLYEEESIGRLDSADPPPAASLSILGFVANAIHERKEKLTNQEYRSRSDTEKKDFLTRFIEVQESNAGIPAWAPTAWTFSNVIAGSDSTGSVMRTVMLNLLTYPHTLSKLYDELRFSDLSHLFPKYSEVRDLPYLDACVQEGARMHPPFALPFERVVPDGGVTVLGHYLPTGTVVGGSPYVVNRDKETFGQDAEFWRPERWVDADDAQRKRMDQGSLTFGAGRRVCLGKHIALLEIKKLIPVLVLGYEMHIVDRERFEVENSWFFFQRGLYARIQKRGEEVEKGDEVLVGVEKHTEIGRVRRNPLNRPPVGWERDIVASLTMQLSERQPAGFLTELSGATSLTDSRRTSAMFLAPLLAILYFAGSWAQSTQQPRTRLRSSAFGVPGQNASYDYVVIGGGTAGITIASRLAEDPSVSVAIIEAGGFYEVDNGNYSVLPGLYPYSPFLAPTAVYPQQPLMDWDLVSVPQTGAQNRRIHYAQGKTLSGSSALNAMAYHRGTIGGYQWWANLTSDKSYTFQNLLPYFRKSCTFTAPDYAKRQTPNATVKFDSGAFSATGGPLEVSYSNWVDPALTWFQRAFTSIGLPVSDAGFNSGSLLGRTAWIPSTINPLTGERSSSQSSFLEQAIPNTNIIVYTQAQASKVLFKSKVASGVAVNTKGVPYTISANKEVILSAGVFHSPQLLMLSGIGPRATLEKYSIPVLSDLAGVGQNLWDQLLFSVAKQVDLPSQAQFLTEPQNIARATSEFLSDASGPFSSFNGMIAFEKIPTALRSNFSKAALTALAQFPADWPEVEYATGTSKAADGGSLALIEAALSAPLSRGTVTIGSADISTPPVINMGWLTDPADADAQVAVAAVKRMREAFATIANITLGQEAAPGPSVQSDAEILEYIRGASVPLYHAGATCAMGSRGDPNAVVDSQARVFGVQGLRVVDLSAAPFVPPGHPQATVYMLAEKIADDIRRSTGSFSTA
ncbi:MAG: hypothetical protein Q9170_002134 [Blastenia crenularia]